MPGGRWGALAIAAVTLAIAGTLLGGCGADDPPPGLSDRQVRSLIGQLDEARAAASLRDVTATEAALDEFRSQVARFRRRGQLSDATARALRTGAARVLERAKSDVPSPEPEPTPQPVAPVPDEEEDDKEKGDGNGKGKGKKKGKGGDD